MISAKDALEKAKSIDNARAKNELEKIEYAVESTVSSGGTYCSVDFWISDAAKQHLEKLGYKVEAGSARNESYTTITWSNPK